MPLLVVFLGTCHTSTHPTTSLHMMSFTEHFPATNVGERRFGYEASLLLLFRSAGVGTWVRAWEQGYEIHFSGHIYMKLDLGKCPD